MAEEAEEGEASADGLHVALCQLDVVAGDETGNVERTVSALRDAAESGAELAVLPELCVSGFPLGRDDADRLGHPLESHPAVEAWTRVSSEFGLVVVGGLVERDGDRLYDAAAVVTPEGPAGSYRKLHLFGPEAGVFDPGDAGLPVFDLCGATVGVAICYDLRFPEVLRVLALRGAELVCVPTAWVVGYDGVAHLPDGTTPQAATAAVQANLSQVFVAMADRVGSDPGPDGDLAYLGASCVVGPTGSVVAGPAPARRESLVHAVIDLSAVEAARHRGPGIDPFEQRRTDVYGELLGYTLPE